METSGSAIPKEKILHPNRTADWLTLIAIGVGDYTLAVVWVLLLGVSFYPHG